MAFVEIQTNKQIEETVQNEYINQYKAEFSHLLAAWETRRFDSIVRRKHNM